MKRTLSMWVHRLGTRLGEITCPVMKVFVGRDGQPPVLTGVGAIRWDQPTAPRFTMTVLDDSGGEGLRILRSDYKVTNPRVDGIVLEAVDNQGTEWNCGWIAPDLDITSRVPVITGSLENIMALAVGPAVNSESTVELYFDPAPRVPLKEWRAMTITLGEEVVAVKREAGRQRLELLGSNIEIARDEWTEGLWVVASTSPALPHPYLEGWLCEPLRVLCGQLIYPRLIARNTGDGRSHVSLQRTCSLRPNVGGLRASFEWHNAEPFWAFYTQCLAFLAAHRDDEGSPKFGANHLSRFHEEVVQAAGSSEWVLALATSSAIEGMCKLAAGKAGLPREVGEREVEEMRAYIQAATCSDELKKRLGSALGYVGQPSVGSFLRALVEKGVITRAHRDAWTRVRHRVAHGGLDATRSPSDDHDNLRLLVELLNTLTHHVVTSR